LLVKELKQAFIPENFLLTAAVGAGKETIDRAYDIPEISQHLDFINLMTYDLHGSWETFTGHHTALYSRSDENDLQQTLNVDFAVKYWINNGAPKHKINIGLATYGRSFTLTSSSTGLGAPAKGAGPAGKYTREGGFLAYYEVCHKLQSGYTRVWNSEQMVPYIYSGTEWIGYEDTQSLTEKVNYAINLGLGGIMFWAIDLDDFRGSFCNQGTYPLIKHAKALFYGGNISPYVSNNVNQIQSTQFTTVFQTQQTESAFSTKKLSLNLNCPSGDGFYLIPNTKCQRYYQCFFYGTAHQSIQEMDCPPNTLFDVTIKLCNIASLVKCSA